VSRKKREKPAAGPFDSLRPLRDELAKKTKSPDAPQAAKKAAPSAKGRTEPEDDALLFRRLFAGVEPLDRTRGRMAMQPIEPSPMAQRFAEKGADEARAEAEAVHEHLRALVESQARFEVSDDGHRVEGRRIDLPNDTLRQLRRGRFPIDGRLDMHGMTVHEARTELALFLRTTRNRGERCVLVIHGKGEHSPGGAGILRGEIAAWLSQGSASEHIAAFTTAQSDDGGEGAVYVMLRR
jgi:DNA-nicking Smr family endonuclease